MENNLPMLLHSRVVVAFDANKDLKENELQRIVDDIRLRGDILSSGDTLLVLGVLHSLRHPMGYYTKISADSFLGPNDRALEGGVLKKVDAWIEIEVKITAGVPIKKIILQEVASYKTTWIILDRNLRRDIKFYQAQTPCKLAIIEDSLCVKVLRSTLVATKGIDVTEADVEKFYSLSKSVESISSDEHNNTRSESSESPVLCAGCGLRTVLHIKESMRFKFSDIQAATSDFSRENLLGEGGFGHVYKGQLKDGQVIAAKLRKEASTQGFAEFHSEVFVLSFARHKNIVMLLGYSSKENNNVLVYEYICNRSLDRHLLNKSAPPLEWHQRHTIAIGTAKGLRFLHEECRGCPIIHRDLRPSNILLTHDFVPMIGDFGLAKWKTNQDPVQTRVLGTLGYLAPEYAENGIVSVRTDVYSFGVVLLQLISGRNVINGNQEEQNQSLLQWHLQLQKTNARNCAVAFIQHAHQAEPLIEQLALHELIDPRIGDSYDTYELYRMARAAYLCTRRRPEMRPSMAECAGAFPLSFPCLERREKGEKRAEFSPALAHAYMLGWLQTTDELTVTTIDCGFVVYDNDACLPPVHPAPTPAAKSLNQRLAALRSARCIVQHQRPATHSPVIDPASDLAARSDKTRVGCVWCVQHQRSDCPRSPAPALSASGTSVAPPAPAPSDSIITFKQQICPSDQRSIVPTVCRRQCPDLLQHLTDSRSPFICEPSPAPSSPNRVGLPQSFARNPSCSTRSVAAEPIACPDLLLVRPHLSALDPSVTDTGYSVSSFRFQI
ncbi:hypothetical protein ACLOJK_013968 [Asimina triloba]